MICALHRDAVQETRARVLVSTLETIEARLGTRHRVLVDSLMRFCGIRGDLNAQVGLARCVSQAGLPGAEAVRGEKVSRVLNNPNSPKADAKRLMTP